MNLKLIITAIISILLGLGIGYWFFGKQAAMPPMDTHDHASETSDQGGDGEVIYTCPMHPQIRQNEPGKCPICGMDLTLLEANTSNNPLVLEMTDAAVKLSNIQTTVIGSASQAKDRELRMTGKIKADERLASSQVVHIPGRIEKLFVSFTGEQVKAGQKVASIYSPELISAQKELLEAVKLQEINPNLLEAAKNKLRYWKINETTIDDILQRGTIQEQFNIYAAASGIVTRKKVEVGDYLRQGEPLFELMNLDKVWVIFDAYEADLANIKIGNRIEFTTAAIPDKIFKTRITFIDPVINPTTRTAAVRAELNNVNGLLKPAQFVSGFMKSKSNKTAQLSVPKTAVLWTGKRSVIYVKVSDTDIPSFEFREIEIGENLGDTYQVINGLASGEEVVTYGSFSIDAAAQLNNQSSMMNRQVSIKMEQPKVQPDYKADTPALFKKQLTQLTLAYITLKDALVETNAANAAIAGEQFLAKLKLIDMTLLKGDGHIYWMKQEKALTSHGQIIAKEKDNIVLQRKEFIYLSDALIQSIKVFGSDNESLFVQHCPMANEDKGAYWLSLKKQIQNPYYGDEMMTCGTVKLDLSIKK